MSAPSDPDRWLKKESYSPNWDERTRILADMITPYESVLEFGCGLQALRRYLPTWTRYTGVDLSDKFGASMICDLNSEKLPDFPPHDVAVFGGVLEYVLDVPRIIKVLSDGVVDSVVLSYAVCWDPSSHPWRRSNGWVNDYHLADLLEMFGQVGGVFRRTEVWHGQYLMRVDLRRTTDGPVSEEHTG